jgi:Ca2+/H+ antiporter
MDVAQTDAGRRIARPHHDGASEGHGAEPRWPLWLAITMLTAASAAAAFVSGWFVAGLTPATGALHISPAFAGLVIVAIAGNAAEPGRPAERGSRRRSASTLQQRSAACPDIPGSASTSLA